MVNWNYFQWFHNWLTWCLLVVYWINVLVIDMTWKFLADPLCNTFQFKILWFRLVSVLAKSFGQFAVSVLVSEPKPKRWFRSYTSIYYSQWANGAQNGVISIGQWSVFNHQKGAIWQSHLAAQKEGVLTAIIFSNHKTFEPHLPNGSSRYVGACLLTSWDEVNLEVRV